MDSESGFCNQNTKQCEGCMDNRISARLRRLTNMIARSRSPQVFSGQQPTENKLIFCKQVVKGRPMSLDAKEYRECQQFL
jgi:hypothetical protein